MFSFRSIIKECLGIDDQDFDNMAEELAKENLSYKGIPGIKGLIGRPGGYSRPEWVQDIVDFRNEKYQEDLAWASCKTQKEDIDRKYDKIDSALGKLDSLPIVLKNRYQILKDKKRYDSPDKNNYSEGSIKF